MSMKKRLGISMVEVVVAVFISTLVLGGAYGIWTRVRREVARSSTRQRLQNELRSIANSMKNDFRSIRAGTFEVLSASQDETELHIAFEKFVDPEETQISHDSSKRVEYVLANRNFRRITEDNMRIFSTSVDTIGLYRAESQQSQLAQEDELFRAGREAMLDVEIVASRPVRGYGDEMHYIEKTSLVMRDEYFRATNPNYVSIFDLAQQGREEVVQLDDSVDALFGPGSQFNAEMLANLSIEQLEGLLEQQQDMLKQAVDGLAQINDQISDVSDGREGFRGFFRRMADGVGNVFGFEGSEGNQVAQLKNELEAADTIDETENAINEIQSYVDRRNREYLRESGVPVDGLSSEELEIYVEALKYRLQDRSMEAAIGMMDELVDDDDEEYDDEFYDSMDRPGEGVGGRDEEGFERIIDVMTSDENMIDSETGEVDVARQRALRDAYESINLGWLGNFGDEGADHKAYIAAQTLLTHGDSKTDMIKIRDIAQDNIDLIEEFM